MEYVTTPAQQPRIGWHYYPDFLHYRENDLNRWLPELKMLGASWITLRAPDDYAIPESFIVGLIQANIQPILHFKSSLSNPPHPDNLKKLLGIYSSWGVKYMVVFDKPNQRSSWSASAWTQDKLVERFIDLYLPYAEASLSLNITPIFPPLEPAGDYWDTAFLREAYSSLIRRNRTRLLSQMILGVYAKAGNRPLNWGIGGPERWPSSQPYYTPNGSQDQRGFRIFDWYQAISNAILGKSSPLILFGAACRLGDRADKKYPAISQDTHSSRHLSIAKALAGEDSELEPLPREIIACNFEPLVASSSSLEGSKAWFQENGDSLLVVQTMRNWALSYQPKHTGKFYRSGSLVSHPIAHYLLITEDLWTRYSKTSSILRNFQNKYKPTIGFSPDEAALAQRVTIFGNSNSIPDSVVEQLTRSGCNVERIQEDGILIASNPEGF